MTLPLPTSTPTVVRCRGRRASGRRCGLVLIREPWRSLGMGEDCAERAGLIPPRPGLRVVAVDEDPTLFDLTDPKETCMSYTHCDHDYAPRFGGPRPRIVTLCGSTRFRDAFHEAEIAETLAGRIVISVGLFGQLEGPDMGSNDAPSEVKVGLDELHKRKIDLADEILVINPGGYIGPSTASEIAYAQRTGKPVRYLHPQAAG